MRSAPTPPPEYDRQSTGAFNRWLHGVVQRIGLAVEEAMPGNLVALVLGGGFGRGEGSVVLLDNVEQPYNDLDFTLIVHSKRAVSPHALADISERFESELHIAVDFSRPLTISDIRRWPPYLMWHDLLNGHIVVRGRADILTAHAPGILRGPLPPVEATRLLLNRGAGLLWALRVARHVEKPPDVDFVRRNYHKAALALGDAIMIAYERYATPYSGRDLRLRQLIGDETSLQALSIEALYNEALQFKFRPDWVSDSPVAESDLLALADRWGQVFLLVEQRRTGRRWASLPEYAGWDGYREPEQNRILRWPRNLVQNRRMGRWALAYPRERLYRQLPGLFDGAAGEPWARDSAAFLDVWRRFG